jgi:methylated-DNA-[protein]-cysteine S-methyltransferase
MKSHETTTPTIGRTIQTPTGPLTVIVTDVGVRAVQWEADEHRATGPEKAGPDPTGPAPSPAAQALLDEAVTQIDDWFAGRRVDFDLPLDEIGTDFQLQAWALLRAIPYGETISYREQAARMGDARKARAIGGANGRNPIAVITPCHRVIGADGSLTGFAYGTDRKRWLLEHESKQSEGKQSEGWPGGRA